MKWLIGDLQGCDDALERWLAEVQFSPSRDTLYCLGDLVNRGPSSLKCLRRLVAMGAKAVLGNHDLHLLAVAAGVRSPHRHDTLQDILEAPDAASLLGWLREQPLTRSVERWLLVHAGLLPAWTCAEALRLGAEVSALMQSADWAAFLPHMYGNSPSEWDENLQGPARWRLLINAMTRLRFVSPTGGMDFNAKEAANSAPPGLLPWFEHPNRKSAGEPIAFGHWSTLGLVTRPDLLALDTGCVWGGCLSAARIDGGRQDIVQIRCAQAQQPAQG
jgi:bis(5'-nucleosyl)-tetraphosphatase (symmetrical)